MLVHKNALFLVVVWLGAMPGLTSGASAGFSGYGYCPVPQESETNETEPQSGSADESSNRPAANASQEDDSIPPRRIRFRLWDGSVLIGDVEPETIQIETEFGLLNVPVDKIVRIRPGLQSFPEMNTRINRLVEQLGDRDFKTRQTAHRQLSSMGIMLSQMIGQFGDGGSAERKKHLVALKEEIQQMADELDEMPGDTDATPLVQQDAIETQTFTAMGTIRQQKFTLHTKHGTLVVGISDLRVADRTWLDRAPDVRKNVVVTSEAFMQTKPISTGIRVQRGDRISIRAEGTINWTNWGNVVSSPDGIPNQGQWRGIPCGKLIARIGKEGTIQQVGSKQEFVAKSHGILYLGIAMDDDYAMNDGFTWTGEYQAKVHVRPASQ